MVIVIFEFYVCTHMLAHFFRQINYSLCIICSLQFLVSLLLRIFRHWWGHLLAHSRFGYFRGPNRLLDGWIFTARRWLKICNGPIHAHIVRIGSRVDTCESLHNKLLLLLRSPVLLIELFLQEQSIILANHRLLNLLISLVSVILNHLIRLIDIELGLVGEVIR